MPPDLEPETGRPRTAGNLGLHRHKLHVHQMSPQSRNIDLCPIGIGIGAQERHDLRHGGKGRLPGFPRTRHRMPGRGMAVLGRDGSRQ